MAPPPMLVPLLLLLAPALLAQAPRTLTCTVIQAPFEYSLADLHGPRPAFDLELCHAVAAALGGNIRVRPLEVPDEASAVLALKAGKADLAPTVSLDLTHATDPTLTLTPPILLDGIGLLVSRSVPNAAALADHKVCFFTGTEAETALHTWFGLHQLNFLPYPFSEEGEMQAALTSGNCPAIAGDLTRLAAVRASLNRAVDYKVLPDQLAPDPLASATRHADPALSRIVLAVEQLLLNAEALGVTQSSVSRQLTSPDPAVARLLGRTHELGPAAGLDDGWPVRVLTAVGNYGELTRRTLSVQLPVPPALPLK